WPKGARGGAGWEGVRRCCVNRRRQLPSIATARAVGELIQQLLRGSQVGGFKSFGEFAVDRSQLLARIAEPALATPQPGEARARPQFPGQNLLSPRPIERLQELPLGRRDGV